MSKEGLSPYQTHEKRIDFIENAVAEGVLDRMPVSERNQNIGLLYNLNEGLTGEKVAKIYPNPSGKPLTKARIYQISERFLKESWNYASSQLQAFHPLEELLAKKPNALGELALRAKSMVQKGITDPLQFQNDLSISHSKLSQLRKTLEERGIDIPRTTKLTIKETFKKIAEEEDDKKLQEFLDSSSFNSLRGFLKKDSNHEILIKASAIANENGFHAHTRRVRFIAETIRKAQIPIIHIVRSGKNGKLHSSYYIVFTKHAERIAEVLRNDPDLERFR